MPGPGHRVTFDVEAPPPGRNRLTCAFRMILAIPHVLLVGGPGGVGWSAGAFDRDGRSGGATYGLLGAAAWVIAVITWFAVVFTGRQPRGLWDFTCFYMTWRSKAVAYMALLRDEYPPFGGGPYPTSFSVGQFPSERDRGTVGFRILFCIPHVIALALVGIGWMVSSVIGWFAILFTGEYPAGLYQFSVGYLRWSLRFESYLLLMHDDFPPFSLA